MHEQTSQKGALPTALVQLLADSEADFIDLSDLEMVMDKEENGSHKGNIVMNTAPPVATVEPQGTLSSRICQIAHECADIDIQATFRDMAVHHPAYAKIHEEIYSAMKEGKEREIFDRLEAIGCEVAFDRSTNKLTLGLNKGRLFKHFNEHSRVIDVNNRSALYMVNGVNPFLEKEEKHHVPTIEYRSYYLVFDIT